MTKFCPQCKTDKDISQFGPNKGRKDGLRSYCKECDRKKSYEYNHPSKICVSCHQRLPLTSFKKYDKVNYRGSCNNCIKINKSYSSIPIYLTKDDKEFIHSWAKKEKIPPTELLREEFVNLIWKERVRQENKFIKEMLVKKLGPQYKGPNRGELTTILNGD